MASLLPLTFCLLTTSGVVSGKFPQTPRCKSDLGDIGGEASPSRLLSPDSSPPVRCPRQRCALLPKTDFGRAADGAGWGTGVAEVRRVRWRLGAAPTGCS